jgi:hypothetical protein
MVIRAWASAFTYEDNMKSSRITKELLPCKESQNVQKTFVIGKMKGLGRGDKQKKMRKSNLKGR